MKVISTICAVQLASALCCSGGDLLLAHGDDYYTFDAVSGEETYVASGALDVVINDSFVLDNELGIALQMGRIAEAPNSSGVTITDLLTGDVQNFVFHQTSFPQFGGFWNGNLIIADNSQYWSFDVATGMETPLTSGSLHQVVNNSFMVDPETGMAYQGGFVNGSSAISVTDLATGESHNITLSKTTLPQFGGFWNGDLMLADNQKFYSFDVVTGEETLLATGTLATAVNFSFVVDPATGIAYQGGQLNTESGRINALSVTNLATGETQNFALLPLGFPSFAGIYSPPEPAQSLEPITSISRVADQLRIEIPQALRRKIGVEYSRDLSPSSWVQLGNFFDEGDMAVFIDPDLTRVRRGQGYYRAFLRPLEE